MIVTEPWEATSSAKVRPAMPLPITRKSDVMATTGEGSRLLDAQRQRCHEPRPRDPAGAQSPAFEAAYCDFSRGVSRPVKILVALKRVADPDNANKVKIPASGDKIETAGLE